MSLLRSGLLASLILLACLGPLAAATPPAPPGPDLLVYKDGNRATGRLVERKDNTIVFASDRFGLLSVAATDADVLPATGASANPAEPVVASTPPPSAPATATPAPKQTPTGDTSPNNWLHRHLRPWRGQLNLALEGKHEDNRRDKLLVELRAQRRWTADELRLNSRYEYTEEDTRTTTDLLKADAYWRHDLYHLGRRLFALYSPEAEYNRGYKYKETPIDYILLKQQLGLGLTVVDHATRKVRLGLAENRFDLWVLTPVYGHASAYAESAFLELELQLPYGIRITDRGTWYFTGGEGKFGRENQLEIAKQLGDGFLLGVRHEVRKDVPASQASNYSLWRILLGLEF